MAATEASISPQELLQSSSTFSAPLLLIAAACGYLDVVKELLGRDDAQIFQRTLVRVSGYSPRNAARYPTLPTLPSHRRAALRCTALLRTGTCML